MKKKMSILLFAAALIIESLNVIADDEMIIGEEISENIEEIESSNELDLLEDEYSDISDNFFLNDLIEDENRINEQILDNKSILYSEGNDANESNSLKNEVHLCEKDSIFFGTYPQKKVTDKSLIENLNTFDLAQNSMVELNGENFINAENSWYYVSPIEWYVLDENAGEALIMSKNVIALYDNSYETEEWAKSKTNSWLNMDFYNMAFDENEKKCIRDSTVSYQVENEKKETINKLFLPSTEMLSESKYGFIGSDDRITSGTDYAGGYWSYPYLTTDIGNQPIKFSESQEQIVYSYYEVGSNGNYGNLDTYRSALVGIRPCLRIDLEKGREIADQTTECEISGRIIWDDNNNQEGKRPEQIVVELVKDNGPEREQMVVTKSDGWTYSFKVQQYSDGKKIKYSVQAEEIDDYIQEIDGYCITYKQILIAQTAQSKMGEFEFRTGFSKGHSWTYDYTYNDNWFNVSSYIYNHDLVKMSIRAAMAGFGEGSHLRATNIKKLMEELNYRYISEEYPYPTKYNSIGTAIGLKKIKGSSENEYTVIFVTVRGAGYESEWGGNFNVGNDFEHEGFKIAAQEVIQRINSYIKKNQSFLSPEVKIWISGYSRAAAVTNLTAAYLDQGQVQGVEPKNIYAFCFECPRNTRNGGASNNKYDNIVNIINPADPVPYVAFNEWGYSRYGKNYYIPWGTSILSGTKYKSQINRMKNIYEQIMLRNGKTPTSKYSIGGFNLASIWIVLSKIISTAISDPYVYSQGLQSSMIPLSVKVLGQPEQEIETPASFIKKVVSEIFRSNIPVETRFLLDKLESMTYPHFPELCLAWIDALSGKIEYGSGRYKIIYVNCPVDVSIYGSENELVGRIADYSVQNVTDGVATFVDENDQKIVILPDDDNYTVKMDATDNGEVTYSVVSANIDNSMDKSVVSYFGIPVHKNETITATVTPEINANAATTVIDTSGKQIEPSVVQSGNEVINKHISVKVEGEGGSVSGEGQYIIGEFVKLMAYTDKGYIFGGWYVNGELLSQDPEYRVLVREDKTYIAKFLHTTNQEVSVTENNKHTKKEEKNPFITMNVKLGASLPLKVRQKSSAVKVKELAEGDRVAAWKSSNPKVVTVNNKGKMTGKKIGTATITVISEKGATYTFKVKVQKKAVKTKKITVASKKVTLRKGEKYDLNVNVSPITSVQKSTYTSSKKSVATIKKGVITAKKKGKTIITVKSGNKKVKIKVTVK